MCGCYNQILVPNDSLIKNNDQDIVVTTFDGKRVSFSDGDYIVTCDSLGQQVLNGEGRVRIHLWTEEEPFQGRIPVDEIDTVHVCEKSFLYYASAVGIITVAAYYLFLAIAFSGGGNFSG